MKLLILQEKLKEGLNIIERVSAKSLTLPILNNVLISCEKNFLNLTATDLEIGINWWALVKIEKEGKLAIPAKVLSGYINLLPNKKIDLKSTDNNLNIECEKYKTQIKGFSADEFPIIPKIGENEFISVNAQLFCKSVAQVVDIPLLSTTRPEISGVYFSFQKNAIVIAATDSFRLGEKKVFMKDSPELKKAYNFIIPQKAIKEVINIFGDKPGDMKIYFSPNQVMFEILMPETNHPHIRLISRLIEGEYPDYQEIIPKKFQTQVVVEKDEFLNQIKSAALFSGKASEIKIKTDSKGKEIQILSQSSDIGEYNSSVPAKIKGEDATVAFNHRFILDGISNIKSSEIILELNGDSGPGLLKPVGDETYLYVAMPIKAN